MPALGSIALGAIAVFVVVLVSLVLQGRRQARERRAQRSDLGLERVAVPDPVLTATILGAFPAAADGVDYTLAGLERVTGGAPGTWYVAMVKATLPVEATGVTETADATGSAASAAVEGASPASMRVLLVIEGLKGRDGASVPAVIEGTNGVWTQRWASGLLLVESAPGAGDAARDFEGMKGAAARAASAPPPSVA